MFISHRNVLFSYSWWTLIVTGGLCASMVLSSAVVQVAHAAGPQQSLLKAKMPAPQTRLISPQIPQRPQGARSGSGESKSLFLGSDNKDELTLGAVSESYLNRDDPPAGYTDYGLISTHLRASSSGRPVRGVIDARGTFAAGIERNSNFEVPDAFFELHKDAGDKLGLFSADFGRKRELWSLLDSHWQMGLVQPLNRYDGLNPTEQGLTGGFFSWDNDRVGAMIFATAIYLPDQQPPYDVQGGEVTSSSPWFVLPPNQLVFKGVSTPTKYRIDTPSIASVVNHPGGGFIIRIGDSSGRGSYAQTSFVRKPRNSLDLPFTGKIATVGNANFGDVGVYPQVVYHNVATLDFGYRARAFSFGVASLAESVDTPELSSDLTYRKYNDMYLLSPEASVRFYSHRFWGPKVSVRRLYTFQGETTSVGPNATAGDVFGPRNWLRQAFSFEIESRIARFGRIRVDQSFRWIEEVEERGTILSQEFRALIGDSWRASVSADVLGSQAPAEKSDTFISRFRGNDRVGAGLTYLF